VSTRRDTMESGTDDNYRVIRARASGYRACAR